MQFDQFFFYSLYFLLYIIEFFYEKISFIWNNISMHIYRVSLTCFTYMIQCIYWMLVKRQYKIKTNYTGLYLLKVLAAIGLNLVKTVDILYK